MLRHASLICAIALPALVGCGDERLPDTPSALQMQLAGAPVEMSLETAEVASVKTLLSGAWVGDDKQLELPLPVRGGFVRVASNDDRELVMDGLLIAVDDFVVGDGSFPPKGATITDASIELSQTVSLDADWNDSKGSGRATLDLTLHWSMMLEDGPLELSAQPIDDVQFEVEVTHPPEGGVALRLTIEDDGELWKLDPYAVLDELEIGIETRL